MLFLCYEGSALNLFNIVSRVVDISSRTSMIAIEFNSFDDLINNILGILLHRTKGISTDVELRYLNKQIVKNLMKIGKTLIMLKT